MTAAFHPSTLANSQFDVFSMPKFSNSVFNTKTSGLYLFGGQDAAGRALNDLWILRLPLVKSLKRALDPHFEWVRLAPGGITPTARYGHTSALVQDYVVVVGGRNDELYHTSGVSHLSEVVVFNIEHNRWESINLAGSPPEGRWGACVEVAGSKLILYGGMELSNYCNSDLCYLETDQDVVEDMLIGDNMMLKFEKALRRRDVIKRNMQRLVAKPSIRQLFRKML